MNAELHWLCSAHSLLHHYLLIVFIPALMEQDDDYYSSDEASPANLDSQISDSQRSNSQGTSPDQNINLMPPHGQVTHAV